MRGQLLPVVLVTIAVAAPLVARADNSPGLARTPDGARMRSVAALHRVGEGMQRIGIGEPSRDAVSPAVRSTAVAAATTPTAAPEMSSGFAVTGLTLLLGGIAVLRSRRTSL